MARHKKGEDINGWLIVDKPRGIGSTDVVNMTRRMFKAKKNGHAGTLDPFATGVLPVAFGEATKLLPLVTDGRKEYEFIVQWGAETNTGDSEGEIVSRCEKVPCRKDILAVLPQFIGEITQVPPAFSAIKINGQRAYDLARRGEDVAIPERKVEVYSLELLEELPDRQAKFRVMCSKGTYVRALGRDLARKLGTLGYLQELRRTKCGKFSLEDTILLENLKKVVHTDALKEFLLPLITSLRDIAVLAVSEADAAKLRLGQGLSPKNYDIDNLTGKQAVAVFEGSPAAIVRIDERKMSPVRLCNC